jgi:hypothetical protein
MYAIITNATEIARMGGLAGGRKGGTKTKERNVGIFAPNVQSKAGKIGGRKSAEIQRRLNLGLFGLSSEERSDNTKKQWEDSSYVELMKSTGHKTGRKNFELGIGIFSPEHLGKGAKTTNSTKWIDPDHPELGAHHFNALKKLQRQKGYSNKAENRVKVSIGHS